MFVPWGKVSQKNGHQKQGSKGEGIKRCKGMNKWKEIDGKWVKRETAAGEKKRLGREKRICVFLYMLCGVGVIGRLVHCSTLTHPHTHTHTHTHKLRGMVFLLT
jgi:hypothetical protein